MASLFRHCSCFHPETEDIQILDHRHCNLRDVPDNVFTYERTLEVLYLDANQIKDLPRPLFHCHGLRVLSLNDNEIESLPPAIASLINLEELDVSHNSILNFPDNIKGCKHLCNINASVNPLGKLPDGLTQLVNLTQLYLNDTFLDFLPANFGRLSQLCIVELRDNHLKTLPKSMGRLVNLKRLDIGNNEFKELPEVVGSLHKLTELWFDANDMIYIPDFIGNLKDLLYLDASTNCISSISYDIDGCIKLQDLHLSCNRLKEVPESIGNLRNLTMLKLDDNRIRNLPHTIGLLSSLQEFVLKINDLTNLPSSIGLLRNLSVMNIDENFLEALPPEIGSCISLTIFSVRTNRLQKVPHELGHLSNLSVLNISDNFIQYLPFSITRLNKLSAIWISENQNKPLVPFQSMEDPETGQRVLTCILLPQIPREGSEDGNSEYVQSGSWKDKQQPIIKFAGDGHILDQPSALVRLPTPYPKEMKAHAKHAKNLALKYIAHSGANNDKNLPEYNHVTPDITACAVDSLCIKEAKLSKPQSASLSTLAKPSTPTYHESVEQSETLMNTTQSADSGMASGLCSDMQISSVQSSTQKLNDIPVQNVNKNQIFSKPPHVEYNIKCDSSNFPSLAAHKIARNKNLGDFDRGYRSDNEFYAENDRNLTSTPEGYHSDWEAMSGKFSHCGSNISHQLQPKSYTKLGQRHHESGGSESGSIKLLSHSPQPSENTSLLAGRQSLRDLPRYNDSSIHPINKNSTNMFPHRLSTDRFSPVTNPSSGRCSTSPTQVFVPLHQSKQVSDPNVSTPHHPNPRTDHNSGLPHHPRQPPDYDTALQRSSLYSKYHGPIDASLGEASQVYSTQSSPRSQVFRIESKPSSRLSHVSDTGSSVSSSTNSYLNMNRLFSSSPLHKSQPTDSFHQTADSPHRASPVNCTNMPDKVPHEVISVSKIPPPLPPKPNMPYFLKTTLSQRQLDESVYKELHDINSCALKNEKTESEMATNPETLKPISTNTVNNIETNDNDARNVTCNGNDPSTHLGFTPISPAPNSQIYNHIVRPSVPSQQWPVKSPVKSGQWMFGMHKNPKVFPVIIEQNPDMGFTISNTSNLNISPPVGIYVESVASDGPASSALRPGDKILEVDGIDFSKFDSDKALSVLTSCKNTLCLMVSRES